MSGIVLESYKELAMILTVQPTGSYTVVPGQPLS